MQETITIENRFRGPPESGNGGYSCGRLARYIDGPACIRLRVPPPLELAMDVHSSAKGVELRAGELLIAEGWAEPPAIDTPAPPSVAEASAASQRFRGFDKHFFPSCFVCGTGRSEDGGLEVFAGSLAGHDEQVALVWQPQDHSLADEAGFVKSEFIWSALDCPGAYSFTPLENHYVLLGELAAEIHSLPRIGDELRLLGWHIGVDGRKHKTGTALFNSDDQCIALARAIWFEIPYES